MPYLLPKEWRVTMTCNDCHKQRPVYRWQTAQDKDIVVCQPCRYKRQLEMFGAAWVRRFYQNHPEAKG